MKLWFNKAKELVVTVSEGREYFCDALAHEMNVAHEVSPCSLVALLAGDALYCSYSGKDYDPDVPPIEIWL